jgi:exoribonuclease-2
VRSRAALSYEQADDALEDPRHARHDVLGGLSRAARALRSRREDAGAISLDQPELSVRVDESGQVQVKVLKRTSPARQVVAEMAILYNVLVAEFCKREGLPAVYRVQVPPDLSDVTAPQGPLRRYLIFRRLFPADLDSVPGPHGGLGVPAYLQATSPLRRYPDLVMQRQIAHYLITGKPFYSPEEIASVMQWAEVQLKELSQIEDARKRYWFLKYLRDSRLVGADASEESRLFRAMVLENEPGRRGLLELAEFPFRVRAGLPGKAAPGDTVALELQDVDLWRRLAYFVHVGDTT